MILHYDWAGLSGQRDAAGHIQSEEVLGDHHAGISAGTLHHHRPRRESNDQLLWQPPNRLDRDEYHHLVAGAVDVVHHRDCTYLDVRPAEVVDMRLAAWRNGCAGPGG